MHVGMYECMHVCMYACMHAGIEKVWYPGSGAASQFQISQPILAGPKAQPASIGLRQPSLGWAKGPASHSILKSSYSQPKSNEQHLY